MRRFRVPIAGVMRAVAVLAAVFASLRFATPLWAGGIFLGTWAVLGSAVLGVVYRSESRRAFWLGFVVFELGFLALFPTMWFATGALRPTVPTVALLDRVFPYLDPSRPPSGYVAFGAMIRESDPQSRDIWATLEKRLKLSFPNETPMEDVIKYIQSSTVTLDLPSGLPIYFDMQGLQKANKTQWSRIVLELDGVPLRTSLRVMLSQLGLDYEVRDGLLFITSEGGNQSPADPDAFQRIGHCWFALLAGLLGGVISRWLHATRDREAV